MNFSTKIVSKSDDVKVFCRSLGVRDRIRIYDDSTSTEVAVLISFTFKNMFLIRKLRKLLYVRLPIGIILVIGFYLRFPK